MNTDVWRDFVRRYRPDPVLFAEEMLKIELQPHQKQVLEWIRDGERRISLRSGHGVGKSCLLAIIMVWHTLLKFPQKTLATAPTKPQLNDALASEVKKWFKALPEPLDDLVDITESMVRLKEAPEESFITFRVSKDDSVESIAGLHSDNMLLVYDEASGISEKIFEASAGSMSGGTHGTAITILAGNPVRATGFFYDTHNRLSGRWKNLKISCFDSDRTGEDFIEDMKARYSENSNQFRVRVLGEWPLADEDGVIPLELVESAVTRDVEGWDSPIVIGVDVARYGGDYSAIVARKGNVVLDDIKTFQGLDTMSLVGRVQEYLQEYKDEDIDEVLIDSIGIGSGTLDRLLELDLDVPIRGINVGESPSMGTDFMNLRAELWFRLRDWLGARDVRIPSDERLVTELTSPRYVYTSSNKRKIESKEEMKRRGISSPDIADALCLTFASDAVMAGGRGRAYRKGPLVRGLTGVVV